MRTQPCVDGDSLAILVSTSGLGMCDSQVPINGMVTRCYKVCGRGFVVMSAVLGMMLHWLVMRTSFRDVSPQSLRCSLMFHCYYVRGLCHDVSLFHCPLVCSCKHWMSIKTGTFPAFFDSMVYFASHCGVTNAVYYASQFLSPFLPLSAHTRPSPLTLDLYAEEIPDWDYNERCFLATMHGVELEEGRWERDYGAVAFIHWGDGPENWSILFFSPECLTRTFFLAAFPTDLYPPAPGFQRAADLLRGPPDIWRHPPTSPFYLYFGCPTCGQYQRHYGFPDVGGAAHMGRFYFVYPLKQPRCAFCGVNQEGNGGTAPGLRLGE